MRRGRGKPHNRYNIYDTHYRISSFKSPWRLFDFEEFRYVRGRHLKEGAYFKEMKTKLVRF